MSRRYGLRTSQVGDDEDDDRHEVTALLLRMLLEARRENLELRQVVERSFEQNRALQMQLVSRTTHFGNVIDGFDRAFEAIRAGTDERLSDYIAAETVSISSSIASTNLPEDGLDDQVEDSCHGRNQRDSFSKASQ